MDTTDTEPHPDLHPERFTVPSDYAGVTDYAEANETYKALFQVMLDTTGLDAWHPDLREERTRLGEDHRRCAVILSARGSGKSLPGAPRIKREHVPRAVLSEDGTQITCVVCDETKSIRKFPTVSGSPGVREGRCRDCRDKAKAGSEAEAVSA